MFVAFAFAEFVEVVVVVDLIVHNNLAIVVEFVLEYLL